MTTKVEGRGLVLEYPELKVTNPKTGQEVRVEKATEMALRTVSNTSKKWFAEKVVPSLPKEAFSPFVGLFDRIEELINEVSKVRGQRG